MNLYQHLCIIIFFVLLVLWGFYAKETMASIVAALIGFGGLVIYSFIQGVALGLTILKYLGIL